MENNLVLHPTVQTERKKIEMKQVYHDEAKMNFKFTESALISDFEKCQNQRVIEKTKLGTKI